VAIAAKTATTMIPIVMVGVVDPVNEGLVASLARPGANVTGLTFEVTREQAGKNLELLKEAVPKFRAGRSLEILMFQPIFPTARRLREQPRSSESLSSSRDASALRKRLGRRPRWRCPPACERSASDSCLVLLRSPAANY
jgi:hypothetical protein